MAYCTLDDLKEQLSRQDLIDLTDDTGAGAVDMSIIARAIADADAEIDGYCTTRYDVPFNSVPSLIRKISVDIAIYNLFTRPGRIMPDERKDRYKNASKILENITKGHVKIGIDMPAASDDLPQVTKDKTGRVFTMGRLSEFSTGTLDNF